MGFFRQLVGLPEPDEDDAPSPPESQVGTFHSAHPIETVMELVCRGVQDQLSDGTFAVQDADVLASIYISELSPDKLVVTAGNTLDTYFAYTVELSSDAGGTSGRAYLTPPFREITRWMGNAMKMHYGVQSILTEASATFDHWNRVLPD